MRKRIKLPSDMYNNLRENLHLRFSKLKRNSSTANKISYSSTSSSTTQLLTKSPSPPHDDHKTETADFFIKNFNSLYNSSNHADDQPSPAPQNPNSTNSSSPNSLSSSPSSISSSSGLDHLAAAAGSDGRFFFSAPGKSKSIVDDEAVSVVISDDGSGGNKSGIIFAIPTYSTDPYADFRSSIEEMLLAAQGSRFSDDDDDDDDDNAGGAVSVCRDYLHGLLICYLALNRKNTHKFIVAAFNDLLLSLSPSEQ